MFSFPPCLSSSVLMLPDLKQVYSGDLFYLSCNSSTTGETVKWFFNNEEQSAQTSKTWRFAVAAAKHSGSYRCETGGSKSDTVNISVLGNCRTSAKLDSVKTPKDAKIRVSFVCLFRIYPDGFTHPWNGPASDAPWRFGNPADWQWGRSATV